MPATGRGGRKRSELTVERKAVAVNDVLCALAARPQNSRTRKNVWTDNTHRNVHKLHQNMKRHAEI